MNSSSHNLLQVSSLRPLNRDVKVVLVNEGVEVADDVGMVQTPKIKQNLLEATVLLSSTSLIAEALSCQKF